MKITIDRIEGSFAVCELETGKMQNIPIVDLPANVHEGMQLEEIHGVFTILDHCDDAKRIQEKMNRLFQK